MIPHFRSPDRQARLLMDEPDIPDFSEIGGFQFDRRSTWRDLLSFPDPAIKARLDELFPAGKETRVAWYPSAGNLKQVNLVVVFDSLF